MNQLELSVKLKLAAEQFVKESARASNEFKQAMSGIEQTAGKAGGGVESGFGKTRQGLVSISQQLQQTKNELIAFFSLRYGAELALSIIKTADAVAGLQSRLKLATTSAAEYATAQSQLFDISQRTGTSMESNVVLYGRIAASMRDMGMAQKDTLAFTEAVAQTMRISGASAASAQAGITQLSQAMSSGVLRGDEFNSVMESSPRLAQALADGLGQPIGALRAMAEAGELTAEKVTAALLSQKDVVASEYASMGLTVSAAMTQLSNAWQKYVGETDQAHGATKSLSAAISDIAKKFNDYANTVITVGKDALVIWSGFAAIKLGAAVAEFAALAREARAAGTAVKAIPGSVKIALLLVGFEVLKTAGQWLGEFTAKLVHGEIESEKFASGSKVALEVAAEATRVARDEAAKLAAEIKRTNQLNAFEHFGESAKSAAVKIEIAAAGMVASFAEVYAKGQDVEKSLDALFKDVNFNSPAGIDAMTQAMYKLGESGMASGKQIQEGLGRAIDKLGAEQLVGLQISAEAALGEMAKLADEAEKTALSIEQEIIALKKIPGNNEAIKNLGDEFAAASEKAKMLREQSEQLGSILEKTLGRAFSILGGDIEKFRTGIDKATREAILAFQAVSENAKASGAEIGAAFNLALKTADTRQEVNALGESLKKAAADGVIAGKDLEDAQSRLAEKVRATAGEVEGALGDAFKRAGIKSKEELAAIAAQAKADFETIRNSGKATAEGIATAEEKYKAAEAAALGVKDAAKGIAEETANAAREAENLGDEMQSVVGVLYASNAAVGQKYFAAVAEAANDAWTEAKSAVQGYVDKAREAGENSGYIAGLMKNIMDGAAGAGEKATMAMQQLEQQLKNTEALAEWQKSFEAMAESSRSAAKSAEDQARGFVSSSRSIHEEMLTAQGREDEVAESRLASRKAELELSYKQLQMQILIAEVQASAAGVDTTDLQNAKHEAAASYNQAKIDLAELARIDADKRKQDKAAAEKATALAAQKATADKLAADAESRLAAQKATADKAAADKAAADAASRSFLDNLVKPQPYNPSYAAAPVTQLAQNVAGGSGQSSESRTTVTLRFVAPSGSAVSGAFSQGDAGKMLDILKQAGARTL